MPERRFFKRRDGICKHMKHIPQVDKTIAEVYIYDCHGMEPEAAWEDIMSKTLKHYRRKKFFYRLLLRKSPRAGAMFGLAWMLMCLMLLPYGLFALLLLFSVEDWPATVPGAIVLFIAIYLYGVIVCAYGLAGILRDAFKTKWLCSLLGFFGAWFTSLLGLAILPGLIRKKRFAAILFAVLGSAVSAAGALILPGAWSFVGTALYLAALAMSGCRGKIGWKFLYPLLVGICAFAWLIGYDAKLQLDIREERGAISQMIGQSIEVADFWKRNDQGFPLTREPLKTLLKEYEASEQTLPGDPAETTAENRKLLAEYRNKHAGLIAALERFLELPPAQIAHEYPENGLFANIRLPELQMFRSCARCLATVIRAEPKAKQQVRKANLGLMKLREWAREDNGLLISHLVAIAIEHIRLEALSAVLGCDEYTEQEFIDLVGDPVEWDRSLLLALGSEVTMFQDCVDHVLDIAASAGAGEELIPIPSVVRRRMPLSLHIFFMRDNRFAMRGYRKMLAAIKKGEVPQPLDESEIKRNCYIFSGMLCPALDRAAKRDDFIADKRSMALLAAKVVEYRKRTGKLPESLDFLPEVPVAKSVKTPFRLEKTEAGFRIVRDKESREDPKAAVYPVWLNNK